MLNSLLLIDNFSFTDLVPLIVIIAAIIVLVGVKSLLDYLLELNETKELEKSILSIKSDIQANIDSATQAMNQSSSDLRAYFALSQRQVRISFSAAIFFSICGFLLMVAGMVISYKEPDAGVDYATAGGAITEMIAGLFLWLYGKALEQMGSAADAMAVYNNKKTSMELVDRLGEQNHESAYAYIITKLMDSGQDANIEVKPAAEADTSTTEKEA